MNSLGNEGYKSKERICAEGLEQKRAQAITLYPCYYESDNLTNVSE